MDVKQEFIRIIKGRIQREGIDELLAWIESTDFFEAPASTKYHDVCAGGLAVHSLNVYTQLGNLCWWYECDATAESIAIVALFHDLCKIGCYKKDTRWRKNDAGKWESYDTWKFEEDFSYGGHGSKSVYLIQNFMKLTPDEASAINCHMGSWDATTYSNPTAVYSKNKLAWLLHVADEAATFIVDDKGGKQR